LTSGEFYPGHRWIRAKDRNPVILGEKHVLLLQEAVLGNFMVSAEITMKCCFFRGS
jgi:hypothetical protein